MENHSASTPTPQALLDDLHALVADAEALFANASAQDGEGSATDSVCTRLAGVQERLADVYAGLRSKVADGAKRADATIRSNPYQSLAIAAGVGLIVGVLLGRRGK